MPHMLTRTIRFVFWGMFVFVALTAPLAHAQNPTPTPVPKQWYEETQPPYVVLLVVGAIVGVVTFLAGIFVRPLFERWAKQFEHWTESLSFRFEKQYLNALVNKHRYLKLVGIRDREGIQPPRLQDVYVSLQMGSPAQTELALSRELSLSDALRAHPQLVILGEPGAGKSTLLRYLVLVFAGVITPNPLGANQKLLPIFIRLKDCATNDKPIWEILEVPPTLPVTKSPPGFFKARLERGKCLVLLDGLDEVVDDAQKKIVAEKIALMVNDFPNNRYVITCRTAGWHAQLVPSDFVALKIRDLNPAQVTRFIHDWYKAVITNEKLSVADTPEKRECARAEAITEAQPRAAKLVEAFDAYEGLARISRNPLILSLIALVHFRRYRLPQRRAYLYRDCLDVLLDQWDRDDKGGIDVPNAPTPETRLEIVQEIAYHFQSNGIDETGTRELANLIAPILNAHQARSSPEECLKEQIEKRSGLLVERAIDRYGFAHRTLQEYLTAKSFAAMPEKRAALLAHLREEPWREVILLYVGLVTSELATEVVREILAAPDDATYSCLLLAGQCLAEDINVDQAVRKECLARLENAFHATTGPLLFIRLATTLAGIGGQDVVDYFERVLNNSNVQVRVVAAIALGALGKRRDPARIAMLLLPVLKDANARVRIAATRSIAQLGHTNPSIAQLLHSLRQTDPDPEARAVAVRALVRLGHADELGLVKIPAGQFIMGSDEKDREKPPHPVHLAEYFIARDPVTNAQFNAFVQAGGYNQEQWWTDEGWVWKANHTAPEKRGGVFDRANHPVIYLTWYEAIAYASWVGMRLPTEQEWEKAASWDDAKKEKRRYPWGNTFDVTRCNTRESWESARGISARLLAWLGRSQSGGATTPVGQYSPRGDSPYGITDMAGNVWEWCGTKWIADYKNYDAYVRDRESIEGNFTRVLRGGSWLNYLDAARGAARGRDAPDFYLVNVGFRVVVSSSPEF